VGAPHVVASVRQLYAKKLQAEIEQIEQAYARDVDTLHKT
jgi:hypothetical protein